MDPSVASAIISVSGSAFLGSFGAFVHFYRSRRDRKKLKQKLILLRNHSIMKLQTTLKHNLDTTEPSVNILMHVIICPLQDTLHDILNNVSNNLHITKLELEVIINIAWDKLKFDQNFKLQQIPPNLYALSKSWLDVFQNTLRISLDMFHSQSAIVCILDTVFNTALLCTYNVISQAHQLFPRVALLDYLEIHR